ncbi:MAG TPA: hypothetical protein VFX60_19120 [Micromonospora sp.]|nr:hypothetical protein [Micromonospora sp.]
MMHSWEVTRRDGTKLFLVCHCAWCEAMRRILPRLDALIDDVVLAGQDPPGPGPDRAA